MEGTPRAVDTKEIIGKLEHLHGVKSVPVDDFHCWSLSRGNNALSCHLVVEGGIDTTELLIKAT